uniref:Uncharacterized protein n=1 Tax=Cucumis melo TaxID=3656 RepID=A0A9I9CS63_CUCME
MPASQVVKIMQKMLQINQYSAAATATSSSKVCRKSSTIYDDQSRITSRFSSYIARP